MKLNLRYLSLALATCAASFASEAAITKISLGYAGADETVYTYDGFQNNSDSPANWSVAVRIPKESVAKYAGGKIVNIKAAWTSKTTVNNVKYWVRERYDKEDLASTTGSIKFGWNTIALPEAYEIPADCDDLWFGYDFVAPAKEYCVATSNYAVNRVPEATYLVNRDYLEQYPDEAVLDVYTYGYGSILCLATLEIDDQALKNMVEIADFVYNPLVNQDQPGTGIVSLTNVGTNNINNFTIRYEVGDIAKEMTINCSNPIVPAPTATTTVKVNVPVIASATGLTTMSISKVNGNANNVTTQRQVNLVSIPDDVAGSYERRPLIEYFVSEREYRVSKFWDEVFWPGIENYVKDDRLSIVCHHTADQFQIMDDEADFDDALLLNLMLANDNKMNVYIPALSVDRARQICNLAPIEGAVIGNTIFPAYAYQLYDEALSIPTFAEVYTKTDYDHEKGIATITVSGEIAEGVLPEGENLRLNLFVTEDNVWTNSQEFPGEKDETVKQEYYHQCLIRQRPTPNFGEELTEGAGTFTRTYEIEIDPSWKRNEMKVIAALTRDEKNDLFNRAVINCSEQAFDPTGAGLANVTIGEGSAITVVNGTVMVDGSAEGVEVYTPAGVRAANGSLASGIYMVKSAGATAKVLVK